jgi:hypothetical protein
VQEDSEENYVEAVWRLLLIESKKEKLLKESGAGSRSDLTNSKELRSGKENLGSLGDWFDELQKMFMVVMKKGMNKSSEAKDSTLATHPNNHLLAVSLGIKDDEHGSVKRSYSNCSDDQKLVQNLLKAVPMYSGDGGPPKLQEWFRKLDDYFAYVNLSLPLREIITATSKLTGNAYVWWSAHIKKYASDADGWIRTWEAFKVAIQAQFIPVTPNFVVRSKLKNLKQTGSVQTFNHEFQKLSMQLLNLEGPDAIVYYLSGIRDDIRSYIISHEANTTDLESIQRACLQQDHNMTHH